MQVEDHPLDYGSFEGTIPRVNTGGGTVMLVGIKERGNRRQIRTATCPSEQLDIQPPG